MDLIVSIEEQEISFFESSGRLNAITYNRHGVPQYHVTLSGEGELWTAIYALNTTPDNLSISVVHVDSEEDPPLTLFAPRQGCSLLLDTGD
ncbi:MAG: hypothetical protein P8J20_00450 [Novosphingobium sp.]|nr:hypothetical protein [Novosphingobium sp.]